MFNQFSKAARAAVAAAVDEAQRRGDTRIGTEHLLLEGMRRVDEGSAHVASAPLDFSTTRLDD